MLTRKVHLAAAEEVTPLASNRASTMNFSIRVFLNEHLSRLGQVGIERPGQAAIARN
jgi:hypothetical protein